MALSATIWGPHYWFVFFTIALNYPLNPNKVTKKKYYDFIQNIPLFIPDEKMGNQFSNLLDKYPVSSYLDSRESFVKWIHFIHNRVNEELNKQEVDYYKSIDDYYEHYKKVDLSPLEQFKERKIINTLVVFSIIVFLIWYLYTKL
jgi:hypothetical protein|tara:strand:- start:474 stop:908 length:435 start_codon:yes stop_codon:yes gene_type:complete